MTSCGKNYINSYGFSIVHLNLIIMILVFHIIHFYHSQLVMWQVVAKIVYIIVVLALFTSTSLL